MKDNKNRCWLFLGPEIGEKQTAIEEIRQKIGDGLEETSYYAGETPVSTIVSAMLNGSLFAERRLFFIKSAEGLKKKEDLDPLTAYIASPPDDTYLILLSEETSAAKALEQSIPPANKKIFWELLDNRKYEWVQSFFRREGFKISAEGIETILELVENNTAALRQECSRLILFLDKNREISGADAEQWLSHTREESVFTLFSRIAAGDFSRALESARILNNEMQDKDLKSVDEFDEIDISAVTEIGNILCSSYLNALATLIQKKVTPSPPMLGKDMSQAILSVPAIEFSKISDQVLLIDSVFNTEGGESASGYFILVPDMDSFNVILGSLGV